MYIRKTIYYPAKVIVGIGNYFWGGLAVIMLMSLFVSYTPDKLSDCVSIGGSFFTIWAGHFFFGIYLQKAKFYNTFLENDKDGILQIRVIAKAIGKSEKETIEDLKVLHKLRLLQNCFIQEEQYPVVVLQNPNLKRESRLPQMQKKICPHCGGENMVRAGFVYQCKYCDGSLE